MSPRGNVRQPPTEPVVFVFRSRDHGPCTVDQQGTQVDITALGDAEQAILAAGAMLSRWQPQRRGHLPALVVLLGSADGGHLSDRNRAAAAIV